MPGRLRTVVIEGAGDATDRLYTPALRQMKARKGSELSIWFTDISSTWKGKDDLAKKRERTIRELRKLRAKYLDKSYPLDGSNAADYDQYLKLQNENIDAVFIATPDHSHAQLLKHWLGSNCKQIFVEKPLDRSYNSSRDVEQYIRPDDFRVCIFDHYRARVHDKLRFRDNRTDAILKPLGGCLKKFSFYLLEDHSGSDEDYIRQLRRRKERNRNGPIENEKRVDALEEGVIFDLMPHMPALLYYFGYIGEIRPLLLRAGVYRGVDFDPNQRTEINGETFAHLQFNFIEHQKGREIVGEAFVGKGVSGSKSLPQMGRNVKALLLEGTNGKKFLFDLRSQGDGRSAAYLIDKRGHTTQRFKLEPDPYYYLLKEIDEGDDRGVSLGLPTATGVSIIEVIRRMRFRLDRMKKEDYATYPLGGIGSGANAPSLEDLLEGEMALDIVYGGDRLPPVPD